ncbi:MAG: hypothetical protein ACOYLB_02765 [Phototrophicaceae bacterium]
MYQVNLPTVLLLACAILLGGCGTVAVNTPPETLIAQNVAFVTEAAHVRATVVQAETQIASTVVALETQLAGMNRQNSALLSTVQAGSAPTVEVVAQINRIRHGEAPPDLSNFPDEVGGRALETYTSTGINPFDECGIDRQTDFPLGTQRVYAIQRMVDVRANTLMGVEWLLNDAVIWRDNLIVNVDRADVCVWFFLEPSASGTWTVQFLSNGIYVGDQVNFNVNE